VFELVSGLHKTTPVQARTSASLVQRCGDHPCPPTGCGSHQEEHDALFRSAWGTPAPSMNSAHNVTRTPGRKLPGALARTMSMRLGHDFSHVRVHDDAHAAASAAYYASHAYTFESHIVFGANQYQPHSQSGQRLLMHELIHVIQAGNGQSTATGISSPSDASEQEASRIAASVGTGDHARVGAVASAAVQRQASPGAQQATAPASNAPAEKWSQTLEAAYRRQGDYQRAAAIRLCREQGGSRCDIVLTQSEMARLYDLSQRAKGNEQQVRTELPRVVPVMGLLGPVGGSPIQLPTIPGVPPPSALPVAGGAAGVGEAGAATALETGAAISAETIAVATGVLAIVAICVIAGIQIWQLSKFQRELESRGFIVLDDALAVCIRGCHTSPVPLPRFREFPELAPTPGLPTSRITPTDIEKLRTWIEAEEPTARTKEQLRPAPRVRAGDPDVEDEERRGCRGRAGAQRGGNTCHDQFATSVSGVSREWVVTTPAGVTESFDARSRGGDTVYEMKTGYGFLGIRNSTPRQRTMIDSTRRRWQRQAARQQLVADMCGYDLVWYFTNEAARAFADGIIQPRTVRVPFRCDVDGERPF
jgi:hypothetical protein